MHIYVNITVFVFSCHVCHKNPTFPTVFIHLIISWGSSHISGTELFWLLNSGKRFCYSPGLGFTDGFYILQAKSWRKNLLSQTDCTPGTGRVYYWRGRPGASHTETTVARKAKLLPNINVQISTAIVSGVPAYQADICRIDGFILVWLGRNPTPGP